MPRGSQDTIQARQRALITLLAEEPQTLRSLQERLPGQPSRGTVLGDLAWLDDAFPGRLMREPIPGGRGAPQIHYSWTGSLPIRLDPAIGWVLPEELSGLVLAQSLVRQVGGSADGSTDGSSGTGLQLGRLLDHPQLRPSVESMVRRTVELSSFGVEPQQPTMVMACLMATLNQSCLHVQYAGLNAPSMIHLAPQRMVLIRNEWYCIGWAGHLRSFRLSRFLAVETTEDPPVGMPATIAPAEVDALLAPAFYATSSARPEDLEQVVLAVSPDAWRQVEGREWGIDQEIENDPADLPEGWRRIRFTTAGLMECRYWVFALGSRVRIESPESLRAWVVDEAARIVAQAQVQAQSE